MGNQSNKESSFDVESFTKNFFTKQIQISRTLYRKEKVMGELIDMPSSLPADSKAKFGSLRVLKAEQLFCKYCRQEDFAHRNTAFLTGMIFAKTDVVVSPERSEELASLVGRKHYVNKFENATV